MMRAVLFGILALFAPGMAAADPMRLHCAELENSDAYESGKKHLRFMTVDESSGWILRTPDMKSHPLTEKSVLLLDVLAQTLEDRFGTRLMVINPPPRGIFVPHAGDTGELRENFTRLLTQISGAGVLTPDILSELSAPPASTSQFYFKRDTHWTPTGTAIAATATAKALLQAGFPAPAAEGSVYKIVPEDDRKLTGTLARGVEDLCGFEIPSEKFASFSVVRNEAAQEDLSAALFSDGPPQDEQKIVLVGTSFSRAGEGDRFRWAGMLRYVLQNDVANRAVMGGGFITAMDAFLSSSIASEHPDLLIWEFPTYYSPTSTTHNLRQLVGTAAGPCRENARRFEHRLQMAPDEWSILPTPAPLSDLIEMSIPGFDIGRVEFAYTDLNGEGAVSRMSRSDRFPADERHDNWRAFTGDLEGHLTRVRIVGAKEPAELQLSICDS